MTEQQLQRGDVVAYASRYFVVWKTAPGELEVFPICFDPGAAFGPFRVSIGEELTGWGITHEAAAVVAGDRALLIRTSPLRAIRVGRCSGGLICRIVSAAARAYATQFIAARGHGECNNNSLASGTILAAE